MLTFLYGMFSWVVIHWMLLFKPQLFSLKFFLSPITSSEHTFRSSQSSKIVISFIMNKPNIQGKNAIKIVRLIFVSLIMEEYPWQNVECHFSPFKPIFA